MQTVNTNTSETIFLRDVSDPFNNPDLKLNRNSISILDEFKANKTDLGFNFTDVKEINALSLEIENGFITLSLFNIEEDITGLTEEDISDFIQDYLITARYVKSEDLKDLLKMIEHDYKFFIEASLCLENDFRILILK